MSDNPTYTPLDETETPAAGQLVYAIITNPRIMETVRDFHDVSMRCAVVIVQKRRKVEEVVVWEEALVTRRFPLDEIREALANYDMTDSVCLVLARDDRVCEMVVSPKETSAS